MDVPGLRALNAGNAGPFTLDGTRTHIVGRRKVAIIDPGPDVEDHVRALVLAVSEAEDVTLLLTHAHSDHAGAAARIAKALGAPVLGPGSGGAVVSTDAGDLIALATPGHTPDHLAWHWPESEAVFVGDLLLGTGTTSLVAGYPGCVAHYLASLDRIDDLQVRVIYPAHGPPIADPRDRVQGFRSHRQERIRQVREALEPVELGRGPDDATGRAVSAADVLPGELVDRIYGPDLAHALRPAAEASIAALLDYIRSGLVP